MDKSFFPIVRACKGSSNGDEYTQRVVAAVAGYTGLEPEHQSLKDATHVLILLREQIAAAGRPIHWTRILDAADPQRFPWDDPNARPYWGNMLRAFSLEICMTESQFIPGYREWLSEHPQEPA